MKRKSIKKTKRPEYPSFQEFHKNKKDFLKTLGIGVVGVAMNSCQPPVALGGVPPIPDSSDTSCDQQGAGKKGKTFDEGVPLGGVIAVPTPGVPVPPKPPKPPEEVKADKPKLDPKKKAEDPFELDPERPMIRGGIGAPAPPVKYPQA